MRLPDLTDKYKMMTRAADQGALDGASNIPSYDARLPTETELNVIQLAQSDLDDAAAEQKTANDIVLNSIRVQEASLPYSLKHTADEFLTSAEFKILEVDRELVRLHRVILARAQEHRLFRKLNRLTREAAPAPSLYVALAWLALAMVGDGALNAYFFKDVGPLGLVGGFLIAFVISACNIALGFLTGWGPLRFFAHRYKLHLLWAIPLFVWLLFCIFFFNLGAAHYRDLIVHSPDVEVSVVIDDVVRNATRIPSFQSCLMALVGCGVAAFAGIKGYTILDPYPWYGWTYKRMRDAERDLEDEVAEIQSKIDKLGSEYLDKARKEYEGANAAVSKALKEYADLLTSNESWEMAVQGVEDACNAVLQLYREANLQVRDVQRFPPPDYFAKDWKLTRRAGVFDRAGTLEKQATLQARNELLRREHEKLQRQVPESAKTILSEANLRKRLEEVGKDAEDAHSKEEELRDKT